MIDRGLSRLQFGLLFGGVLVVLLTAGLFLTFGTAGATPDGDSQEIGEVTQTGEYSAERDTHPFGDHVRSGNTNFGTTAIDATNRGGSIAIGDDGDGADFESAFQSETIFFEGVIDEEANTWESTAIEFADVEIGGFDVEVEIPDGFAGEFDRDANRITAEGELILDVAGMANVPIEINATSETSGELTGSTDIGTDGGTATLVDNEFSVGSTGNLIVDGFADLPADDPGENRLELPIEFDLESETPNFIPGDAVGLDLDSYFDEYNRVHTDATGESLQAGEPASIDIPASPEPEAFQADQIAITPAQDTDVAVSIVSSSHSLETTPSIRAGFEQNTTMVGNLSIESNLEPHEIESVALTATVEKDQLDRWDSDPENVTFQRFDQEANSWVEFPTAIIDETETDATIAVQADHFSEWTVTAARPDFDITESTVDVESIPIDDEVMIQVFVENRGGTEGTYVADLIFDGEVIDSQEAIVAKGGEELFQFELTVDEAGTYEVSVNDGFVEEIQVSTDGESDSEDEDGPGFGTGVAIIALGVIGILSHQQRRKSSENC